MRCLCVRYACVLRIGVVIDCRPEHQTLVGVPAGNYIDICIAFAMISYYCRWNDARIPVSTVRATSIVVTSRRLWEDGQRSVVLTQQQDIHQLIRMMRESQIVGLSGGLYDDFKLEFFAADGQQLTYGLVGDYGEITFNGEIRGYSPKLTDHLATLLTNRGLSLGRGKVSPLECDE